MTLVPPSITTCPGQTVMFNCTARSVPIRWSVFTPNMNYTNLDISNIQVHRESMDGVIMADRISLDVSTIPITVGSSLTVNVTAEHEGSKVQCLGFTANGQDREIKSGFIHITGNSLDTSIPQVYATYIHYFLYLTLCDVFTHTFFVLCNK